MFTCWVYTGQVIHSVSISPAARKDLRRVPRHVAVKLMAWIETVEVEGLERVRRMPGFHDEPLKGPHRGERSIRLSHAYRAIYSIGRSGGVEFVSIEGVTKHAY